MRHARTRRPPVTLLALLAVMAVATPTTVWLLVRPERTANVIDGSRAEDRAGRAARPEDRCAGQPLSASHELRGMWLTTVRNLDFPSRPGLDEETVKAEYRGWLDLAQRLNHNAIFVHVRPSGDAFWPSDFAPWSDWLTGRRDGVGPGWDPLQFMVNEAHARNLEFHAWFNPYKGSQIGDPNQLQPDHPLRKHPEWQVVFPATGSESRLYYNPGIPEARKFVEDSILEVVRRYDVDGVHFDDFFYPYPVSGQDFPDDPTFTQFGTGFASKGDWRRDNVNRFVQETGQRIKQIKPWVKYGISPFGIWRNNRTDPAGSATKGLQSFDEIYADTRLWVKQQWLDYIAPQLYWNIGFEAADYAKLLPWWADLIHGTKVQLYIGQADYRVGQSGAWSDPEELNREMALNRQYKVSGSIHFSARNLRDDKLGAVARYRDALNAAPALVPPMAGLPSSPPKPPTGLTARGGQLSWRSPATSFAIYKVDQASGTAKLVGTTRATSWTDRSSRAGTYCVTALDRSWNEGEPSAPVTDSP